MHPRIVQGAEIGTGMSKPGVLYDEGTMKPKTQRLAFDFPTQAVEELDTLRAEFTHQETRADLLRDALKLYKFLAEHRADGYEVLVRKEVEKTIIDF